MESINKLRKKETIELNNDLEELRQQLFAMRFQNALGKLENPYQIATVRKDIARILTILCERNMQSAPKEVKKTVVKNVAKKTKTKKIKVKAQPKIVEISTNNISSNEEVSHE